MLSLASGHGSLGHSEKGCKAPTDRVLVKAVVTHWTEDASSRIFGVNVAFVFCRAAD